MAAKPTEDLKSIISKMFYNGSDGRYSLLSTDLLTDVRMTGAMHSIANTS